MLNLLEQKIETKICPVCNRDLKYKKEIISVKTGFLDPNAFNPKDLKNLNLECKEEIIHSFSCDDFFPKTTIYRSNNIDSFTGQPQHFKFSIKDGNYHWANYNRDFVYNRKFVFLRRSLWIDKDDPKRFDTKNELTYHYKHVKKYNYNWIFLPQEKLENKIRNLLILI